MERADRDQERASTGRIETALVVAGAGTGKTSTLVRKVTSLIAAGVNPGRMIILTFSRLAAGELRERMSMAIIGEIPRAMTFHSYSWGLLNTYRAEYLRMTGCGAMPDLLAEDEASLLWEEVRYPAAFSTVPRRVLRELAAAGGRIPRTGSREAGECLGAALEEMRKEYHAIKRMRNVIDYDDCLTEALELLNSCPGVRAAVMDGLDYCLVDEFQDSSDANIHLIQAIVDSGRTGLFAVGDDWQAIYSFRGGRPRYLVRFRDYFPGARVYYLKVNYRSRMEIVRLSSRFIGRNRMRTRKHLRAFRGRGGRVRLFLVDSFNVEMECAAEIALRSSSGEVAILYRNNWQGDALREYFAGRGIHAIFLTFHGSKGLEFPTVIVAGINDMVVPHCSAPLEEERRLVYVALSRARDRLFIIGHRDARGRVALFARELGLDGKDFNPPR